MKGLNFDDLKFNLEMNQLDKEISGLKSKINDNMDSYFIDEDETIYNTMMKNYTGGEHKVYRDEDRTDFTKYNEYKNSFLNKFNKY
ncbi:MAG: hypothetical protein MJ245_03740 [Clostridia bacterium]|nr:hypothetical protein [Clostridia bacterium]